MGVVVKKQRKPFRGRGRFWVPRDSGLLVPEGWSSNDWLYEWGPPAARLFGLGDINYRIGALYIEFENVADPDDAVEVPTFGRSDGKSYYDSLENHATKDFIRAVVSYTAFDTSDAELFSQPNILKVAASTAGTTGFHGREFSAAANSKIYGAAAVVTPDWLDPTQDLVVDRVYKEAADQVIKPTNGHVFSEIELTFD